MKNVLIRHLEGMKLPEDLTILDVKSRDLKSSPHLGTLNSSRILPRGQYTHKIITTLKPKYFLL